MAFAAASTQASGQAQNAMARVRFCIFCKAKRGNTGSDNPVRTVCCVIELVVLGVVVAAVAVMVVVAAAAGDHHDDGDGDGTFVVKISMSIHCLISHHRDFVVVPRSANCIW